MAMISGFFCLIGVQLLRASKKRLFDRVAEAPGGSR